MLRLSKKQSIFSMMSYREMSQLQTPPPPKARQKIEQCREFTFIGKNCGKQKRLGGPPACFGF
jgi:hypothetical protein